MSKLFVSPDCSTCRHVSRLPPNNNKLQLKGKKGCIRAISVNSSWLFSPSRWLKSINSDLQQAPKINRLGKSSKSESGDSIKFRFGWKKKFRRKFGFSDRRKPSVANSTPTPTRVRERAGSVNVGRWPTHSGRRHQKMRKSFAVDRRHLLILSFYVFIGKKWDGIFSNFQTFF